MESQSIWIPERNLHDQGRGTPAAEKAAAGIDHLPDTLREAVAFMEEDSFVKMVLGQEFVDLYVEAKKAEWNEYMSQVSEWEVDKYLYRT